jgi:AraC-like DNA-binding protein
LLQNITILFASFSIISALLLAVAHFNCREYKGKPLSRFAGFLLLFSLLVLQYGHFSFLQNDTQFVTSPIYLIVLFLVAPAFYFYSRDVLKAVDAYHPLQVLHFLPALLGLLLPREYALPLAFFIGTGYVVWLAKIVYSLRDQRARFKLELIALAAMSLVAILVLLLGISLPLISEQVFYETYAILIGLAFVVVIFTLLRFPNIKAEVTEAAEAVYASSTLKNLDSNALELKLRQLMEVDKLYVNETLSLSNLAEQMEINTHQLSEFINTHFGKSFSQLIREYRVDAAREMLINEPEASVLSIGLSVGFNSQSSFYTAFRDIVGMAPGSYRKSIKNRGGVL